jgi:hypothetical protein
MTSLNLVLQGYRLYFRSGNLTSVQSVADNPVESVQFVHNDLLYLVFCRVIGCTSAAAI